MKCISNIIKMTTILMIASLVASCSTDISKYEKTTPELDIQEYFNGPVTAWGMLQDYNNKVTRRFCVEMQGSWQKNVGTLAETFYFNDGEISTRNWQLTRNKNGDYTGTADDVIGIAQGKQKGFALQWQYKLSVKIDEKTYQFNLDDWMYRIDEFRVFNQTKMKKFGVTLANITIFFDKEKPLRQCSK